MLQTAFYIMHCNIYSSNRLNHFNNSITLQLNLSGNVLLKIKVACNTKDTLQIFVLPVMKDEYL